jgi:hypothetical protein
MIRRPASSLRIKLVESEIGQIELLDKGVNNANRIILADPVLQAIGKQRDLPAILAFNK